MGKWPSCQICALSSSFYAPAVLRFSKSFTHLSLSLRTVVGATLYGVFTEKIYVQASGSRFSASEPSSEVPDGS
jgi:hypothetical protein